MPQQQQPDHPRRSARRRRRKSGLRVFLAGIFVLCLAGLLVWGGYTLITRLVAESPDDPLVPDTVTLPDGSVVSPDESDGGSTLVAPVDLEDLKLGDVCVDGFFSNFIRHDFPPFPTPDEADEEHLLSFGIWQAIMSEEYAGGVTFRDTGHVVVTQETVEAAVSRYFRRTAPLNHRTVEIYGVFEYDPQEMVYVLPIFGIEEYYLPRIRQNERDGEGRLVLTVEYISAMEQDSYQYAGGPQPTAKKVTVVTLTGENGEYTIESLDLLRNPE